MLTSYFTEDEVASLKTATSVSCIDSVVVHASGKVAFAANHGYTLKNVDRSGVELENDQGDAHHLQPKYFREHFVVAARAPAIVLADTIHLSEVGLNAGRRYCLADRSDGSRSVHGMYAPLNNDAFRAKVCKQCLMIWAMETYSDGEPMPAYIAALRAEGKKAEQVTPAVSASSQPQLERS